jgi:hypothetical protein
MSQIFENQPSVVEIGDLAIDAYPLTDAPNIGKALTVLSGVRPFSLRYDDPAFGTYTPKHMFELLRAARRISGIESALDADFWQSEHASDQQNQYVGSLSSVGLFAIKQADYDLVRKTSHYRTINSTLSEQLHGGMFSRVLSRLTVRAPLDSVRVNRA